MNNQNTPKPADSPLTLANLCCLTGVCLILYAAFLQHTALGFFLTGVALIVVGVLNYRAKRDTERRQSDQ